jgi:hypothetical protein
MASTCYGPSLTIIALFYVPSNLDSIAYVFLCWELYLRQCVRGIHRRGYSHPHSIFISDLIQFFYWYKYKKTFSLRSETHVPHYQYCYECSNNTNYGSTSNSDWVFSWFSSPYPSIYRGSISNMPQPFPSKQFSMHHSPIILPSDAIPPRYWQRRKTSHNNYILRSSLLHIFDFNV